MSSEKLFVIPKRSRAIPIIEPGPEWNSNIASKGNAGNTPPPSRAPHSARSQNLHLLETAVAPKDSPQAGEPTRQGNNTKHFEVVPGNKVEQVQSIQSSPLQAAQAPTAPQEIFDAAAAKTVDLAFDVYARPFVPRAFSIINEQPAYIVQTPPIRAVNYLSYSKTFIGSVFFHDSLVESKFNYDSVDEHVVLAPENYGSKLLGYISAEQKAQEYERANQSLYSVGIHVADRERDSYICRINIPGVRENSPRVEVGDVIKLRQLRLDPTGKPFGVQNWLPYMHRSLLASGWTGIEYHARITGIDRNNEVIFVKINGLHPESMVFNVKFTVSEAAFSALRLASSIISEKFVFMDTLHDTNPAPDGNRQDPQMDKDEDGSTSRMWKANQNRDCNIQWVRRMLFPAESDGVLQRQLNRMDINRHFYDKNLNFEQIKALQSICTQNYGEVPFLISGPPGTGKTKTIVEAALQLTQAGSQVSHVLVCAPSDPAADTLTQRLRKNLNPAELFRLNGSSRTFAEVPGDLLPYCFIENDMFTLPPFSRLMQCKIVVTTCRDAAMLLYARLSNVELFHLEHGIISALHPEESTKRAYSLHWGALLIDEAAQAFEPAALIPLAVVLPPYTDSQLLSKPLFLMAGDQKQLGPRTACKTKEVQTSLFERLFDRPLYTEHPLARSRTKPSSKSRVLTKEMLPIIRPPFANLIRNYRSHPAIIAVPSALFYHDTLIPEATNTGSLQSWSGWRGRRWPVLFACNAGPDEIERDGGGWYNIRETNKACEYALSLIRSGLIREEDICIMSPYRAQVRLLRSMIRKTPYQLWNVNIGPMEAFQGLESRFVIICTTRTRQQFLGQDRARGLGMIHEPKRFNVAVTRAKEGLLVIGNPLLLQQDLCWVAFMSFCRRHDLWEEDGVSESFWQPQHQTSQDGEDPEFQLEPSKPISILESALLLGERAKGNSDTAYAQFMAQGTDDEMWVGGMEAALAFEDDAENNYEELSEDAEEEPPEEGEDGSNGDEHRDEDCQP